LRLINTLTYLFTYFITCISDNLQGIVIGFLRVILGYDIRTSVTAEVTSIVRKLSPCNGERDKVGCARRILYFVSR